VARYLSRISGPLLDRIDIQVEILPVPFEKLSAMQPGEPSAAIRARVIAARAIQSERFKDEPNIHCNAQMNSRLLNKWVKLDENASKVIEKAMIKYDMSARAYDRILKVARTIADLDGSENVTAIHIHEAVSYRNLDRSTWGATIPVGS
jgi:magnesium chelatase family protein